MDPDDYPLAPDHRPDVAFNPERVTRCEVFEDRDGIWRVIIGLGAERDRYRAADGFANRAEALACLRELVARWERLGAREWVDPDFTHPAWRAVPLYTGHLTADDDNLGAPQR